MIRFSTLPARMAAAILLGAMLVLTGCHSGAAKTDEIRTADMRNQFDTVIQAYKGGQFLVDGAVLSALDAGSHFAYLKEQGHLPKTVLLVPSDDYGIRKQHLQYLARLQLDYGFSVYYDEKGMLRRINPVDTKARDLEDYHPTVQSTDDAKDASHNGSQAAQQH